MPSGEDNHNDSMIAVATSSISGANAGGNGAVGLWSYHRPFMPLSIVEGHADGAVTDFSWIDAPPTKKKKKQIVTQIKSLESRGETEVASSAASRKIALNSSLTSRRSKSESPSASYKYSKDRMGNSISSRATSSRTKRETSKSKTEQKTEHKEPERLWQNIISVGRDGQCLIQNFSHGEKPVEQVPSATFAMANFSPFQPGYGSLQIMAVHQTVKAPGILKENTSNEIRNDDNPKSELVFSVTDQGNVNNQSRTSSNFFVDVAPEVTHLSRFSERYKTKLDSKLTTKAALCRHNANVANGLNRASITQMWLTLACLLDGSEDIPSNPSVMAHVLMPTLGALLLQRADAGDVQTCVVLCELLDIIIPPATTTGLSTSKVSTVSMELIREWYLSYIDLLQQMCLFTQAANLIGSCRDPVIAALNQQSTTIHESCPRCGKPLPGAAAVQDSAGTDCHLMSQRVCKSCRGRIGHCSICHGPVKGIFVWCPGCGHGGHLECLLDWFSMNEVCPTGCGHKCNLFPNCAPHKSDALRRNSVLQ